MATIERYVWGKTAKGYGWVPWKPSMPSIERDGTSGYWGVYNPDGSQICLCVDRKGAERVLSRLKRAELAVFRAGSGKDVAVLRKTKTGWLWRSVSGLRMDLCGSGQRFPTQRAAQRFIHKREHVSEA
jgi:hypothetical protein